MKNRVLVTGGAGYIGSHTAVELVNAGYEVVLADNLTASDGSAVAGVRSITGVQVPFEKTDVCDQAALRELFERYEFDSVIHLAAYKVIGESVEEPLAYYHNNLVSFMNVIRLMRETGRRNIILSSSAAVYGVPECSPVTELSPLSPAYSPYGKTKLICEDILSDSIKAYESLRGISLRYFNPVGSHPSALLGEIPAGVPSNLVPYITQTAAGVRESLRIYGNDYDTPDGTCMRDFIDITDLARAHVAALTHLVQNRHSKRYAVYNIGTGCGTSVFELVEKFQQATGVKLNYQFAPRREGDVTAIWADASLANAELGWRATVPLEETLQAAWEWEKKQHS